MQRFSVFLSAAIVFASPLSAQTTLSQQQLDTLLANGAVLSLGSPEMGYSGELKLAPSGTGKGSVVMPSGETRSLTGKWSVRKGKFCRQWIEFDKGNEICESWVLTSPNSVDVMVNGKKIGVNSW